MAWNRFDGHDKNMLPGHSDDHTADIGRLRVTYHHNYFNGTNQRDPRVRFGDGAHVVDNHYRDIDSYGVATTVDAGAILEANYFENVDEPVHIGEGNSEDGRLIAIGNHLVNSGEALENGGFSTSLPYSFPVDEASRIAPIASGGAGASQPVQPQPTVAAPRGRRCSSAPWGLSRTYFGAGIANAIRWTLRSLVYRGL